MRNTTLNRKTLETDVTVSLALDGSGNSEIVTGIGFFDHMLTALAKHAGFDLTVHTVGDLAVDAHHTIEDTGIVLGDAFSICLAQNKAIARYGFSLLPMDESLARCALDCSGRPFLVFDCDFSRQMLGQMDTQLVGEFFRAFAFHAGITLHLAVLYGNNDHHKCEALFKACAQSLKAAVQETGKGVPSTKGVL